MNVLVTGGTGYIGSHTCLELLRAGYQVTVVDNLVNSYPESLERVQELSGAPLAFFRIDLRDRVRLRELFQANAFDAVIHFAGLKAPGESVSDPLKYYHNNLVGTLELCRLMQEFGPKKMVFSSSATVYGAPDRFPITEDFPVGPINPYGRSKLMIEEFLKDLATSDPAWSVLVLRYFNPAGAHPSGRIGEEPRGVPSNLFPRIAQVAMGQLEALQVFGDDYLTPDGTAIRDYIHVVDLALGHLRALERLELSPGVAIYNLGTGQGYSVLEVVAAFERASGRQIPCRFVERRPGDAPVSFADPSRAERELDWAAERGLDQMCADVWRWRSGNPAGYSGGVEVKTSP